MALTPSQQTIQNQIDALDSSASIDSLLTLLNNAKTAGDIMWGYDSTGVMPRDSAYIGNIFYDESEDYIYYLKSDRSLRLVDSDFIIAAGPSANLQGSSYGYTIGSPNYNIQKYSYTSDANSTDVGDLLTPPGQVSATASSPTHGYKAGGFTNVPFGTSVNAIEKFPFSVDENSTDVGDLLELTYRMSGTMSDTHGYAAGGDGPAGPTPGGFDTIQKYPFAADANSTDVGNLLAAINHNRGSTSSTHGYSAGGGPTIINVIQKYAFAVDGNSTDVGDLLTPNYRTSDDIQSDTYSYVAGGSPLTNVIQKWPHASDENSSDVGDISASLQLIAGSSSTTSGYTAGGTPPSVNVIQKFPFSTDANATDVGDLLEATSDVSGAHV